MYLFITKISGMINIRIVLKIQGIVTRPTCNVVIDVNSTPLDTQQIKGDTSSSIDF